MLDETLIVWTTEFGRTPFNNLADAKGREHHNWAFSSWLAGAGVKPGIVHGATDEYGVRVAQDPVHVHDFHATILHLMGLDHERLTYRHSGRDYRLTDVHGRGGQRIAGVIASAVQFRRCMVLPAQRAGWNFAQIATRMLVDYRDCLVSASAGALSAKYEAGVGAGLGVGAFAGGEREGPGRAKQRVAAVERSIGKTAHRLLDRPALHSRTRGTSATKSAGGAPCCWR